MYISSIDNQRIKDTKKLNEKKYRDEKNLFIIEGLHSVIEAYKNNFLKQIILLDGEECDIKVDTITVDKKVMNYIYKLPSTPKILGIVEKKSNNIIGDKILILDNIQDPGNLGTIIRSAVAFSFDTIILGNDSIDLYNEKVLRSTEGMIFNINIIRDNLIDKINYLKNKNYIIYGTNVVNGINTKEVKFSNLFAIVMGNEGRGIKEEIKNLCDEFLYIPMSKKCESLNLGVATSIIMYETSK